MISIPFEVLSVFVMASVALGFAPGPDNIFVLTQSAMNGRAAGLIVTLGLCSGLIVHTAAVALGVAAIFATSETAFTVLKMIGAGYLLYLAYKAFRAGVTSIPAHGLPKVPALKLYLRGVIMNITNAKVAIFFLAFLPQFADPARGSVTLQIFVFGLVFMMATIIVFGGIALFAGALGERLAGSVRAQKILNWVAGAVFVGLAARLLIAER